VDAGTRRQAFYNDLPPRNYRFRVMASDNNAVWNGAGASFDFSIAPMYYQTAWFASLIVAALLASLAALYQMRLRYLKHQFNIRLEARVGERTRIARDLHDTLLQSFQGVLLKFSSLKYMIPDRPEAVELLERTIDQARAAITEGRDAVQGLRSSVVVANDLARAIATFGKGLVAGQLGENCSEFSVQVEGKSRDLPPLVRDEVYQIACESLRNTFRHAQARRIEVQIRYDPRQFRLHIVDNGKGIDPAVLGAGGRSGHHGLPGLHERAQLAGGKLSVWSQLNSGTEIELTIPAAIAYIKSTPARRSFSGKGDG
jgi:signal transduction histidine kinase